MKVKLTAIAMMALLALTAGMAQAQHNVVGYNYIVVPTNADLKMSMPFTRQVEATLTVGSRTDATLNVANSLSGTSTQYYLRFMSGSAKGLWTNIASYTGTTITLNGTGGSVLMKSLISGSDTFRVYKHQTLSTLFPPGQLNVSYLPGTGVNIYDNNVALASMRQNLAAAKQASYNSGAGRWSGSGINNDTPLPPETQFIVRNNSATQALKVLTMGYAPDYTARIMIAPGGDLLIGSGYPVPVVLKNAGLGGASRTVIFYADNTSVVNRGGTQYSWNVGSGKWSPAAGNDTPIKPSQMINLRLGSSATDNPAGTIVTINKPY
jgi:uncharacterized protein (TIGR02597 family)